MTPTASPDERMLVLIPVGGGAFNGLLAHMQGYPPAVSIEFARKMLWSTDRPSFYEVEEAVSALPAV